MLSTNIFHLSDCQLINQDVVPIIIYWSRVFVNNIHEYFIFFQIVNWLPRCCPDHRERRRDKAAGERWARRKWWPVRRRSPISSKAPKISNDYVHYYSVWYTVNANDHTDDVSPSQVSCWRKKWIKIPNTTLKQFKWVRSTQDSQVVVRCSKKIIMTPGSQENEQEWT